MLDILLIIALVIVASGGSLSGMMKRGRPVRSVTPSRVRKIKVSHPTTA